MDQKINISESNDFPMGAILKDSEGKSFKVVAKKTFESVGKPTTFEYWGIPLVE